MNAAVPPAGVAGHCANNRASSRQAESGIWTSRAPRFRSAYAHKMPMKLPDDRLLPANARTSPSNFSEFLNMKAFITISHQHPAAMMSGGKP